MGGATGLRLVTLSSAPGNLLEGSMLICAPMSGCARDPHSLSAPGDDPGSLTTLRSALQFLLIARDLSLQHTAVKTIRPASFNGAGKRRLQALHWVGKG